MSRKVAAVLTIALPAPILSTQAAAAACATVLGMVLDLALVTAPLFAPTARYQDWRVLDIDRDRDAMIS